jgi:MFS transporter, DHA1 family, 2-module integral membrane pump EmrD
MSSIPKNNKMIVVLLMSLIAIAQLNLTLYLPSLPDITQLFHTTSGAAQATLSAYLITFGLSQLIYGPLSDTYGRRPIILVSLLMTLAATLFASLSHSIVALIIARMAQGAGTGSILITVRATVRDRFQGYRLASIFSLFVMVAAITPAIAPLLGGHIHSRFSWRANFYVLFGYTLLVAVLFYFFFEETNVKEKKESLSFSKIVSGYRFLFTRSIYLAYTATVVIIFAFQVIYLTAAPFIYQHQLKLPPHVYGTLMMLPAGGFFLGNLIAMRLNKHHVSLILVSGVFCLFFSGLFLLACNEFQLITIYTVTFALAMMMLGNGLLYAHCIAGTLKSFPTLAGTAAAFAGSLQMVCASIFGASIDYFQLSNPLGLGFYFITLSLLLAFLFARFILVKEKPLDKNHEITQAG